MGERTFLCFWRTVKREPGPTKNIRLWLAVSFPRRTNLRDGNGNRWLWNRRRGSPLGARSTLRTQTPRIPTLWLCPFARRMHCSPYTCPSPSASSPWSSPPRSPITAGTRTPAPPPHHITSLLHTHNSEWKN